MERITIRDARTGKPVTGKLVKRYAKGLCIDDARDIRHYATFDRVITDDIQPRKRDLFG